MIFQSLKSYVIPLSIFFFIFSKLLGKERERWNEDDEVTHVAIAHERHMVRKNDINYQLIMVKDIKAMFKVNKKHDR